jgi:hypothetical protein
MVPGSPGVPPSAEQGLYATRVPLSLVVKYKGDVDASSAASFSCVVP